MGVCFQAACEMAVEYLVELWNITRECDRLQRRFLLRVVLQSQEVHCSSI